MKFKVSDFIILALGRDDGRSLNFPDLVVASWNQALQRNNPAMCLSGYEGTHPDSRKVAAAISGQKGMVHLGYILATQRIYPIYSLSISGREIYQSLMNGAPMPKEKKAPVPKEKKAPEPPSPEPVQVPVQKITAPPHALEHFYRRRLHSAAYVHYIQEKPVSYLEALTFLDLSDMVIGKKQEHPPNYVKDKIREIGATCRKLCQILTLKDQEPVLWKDGTWATEEDRTNAEDLLGAYDYIISQHKAKFKLLGITHTGNGASNKTIEGLINDGKFQN